MWITQYGFGIFFSAEDGFTGRELWISLLGYEPSLVKDISTSVPHPDSNPEYLTEFGGAVYFAATSYDGTGRELWKTNGTEAGTKMVKDINPSGSSSPKHLTAANGHLFFSADDGMHGEELWVSDGTALGTMLVADLNPTGSSSPHDLLNVNGSLYFFNNGSRRRNTMEMRGGISLEPFSTRHDPSERVGLGGRSCRTSNAMPVVYAIELFFG
jgi:ELWxxDGT repeat protein